MKLQNILFPSTDTCTEELMYFRRGEEISYSWSNDGIGLAKGGILFFDTYFNGFSIEKWAKYTNIKTVFLTIRIEGHVRVTLMRKEKSGTTILTDYVGEHICKAEYGEITEFTLPFQSVSTNGIYCFSITSLSEQAVFYGGSYSADLAETDIQPVKIAIDICTYRRERFVEKNLKLLNTRFLENPDSFLYDKLEVFISDNAHTLNIPSLQSDKIHIVQNKNVGGAGGFTRGMIEISRVREAHQITHILVMDDDIVIEPESLFRTCTFLACRKETYQDIFVGGAMLRLDTQCIQTEAGAVWNSGELISLKHGLDLRQLDACLYNEIEEKTEYNAWWYCAFPAKIVSDENLPMPIFIRGDDVEYGLRNMKYLVLMNGICVWHEPFENKYSSALYYYILRNGLIDNSLHNRTLPKKAFRKVLRQQVLNEMRLYRYKNANLLMQGVEDFFRGVDWLAKQDGEALHKAIMQAGYKLQYTEDLEENVQFSYPIYEAALKTPPATKFHQRIINRLTMNGLYLPVKRAYNIVPTEGVQQSAVYRTETILNYDYSSRKGFVTKRDPETAKQCTKRLKALYKLIDKNYDAAIQNYAQNGRKLMQLSFWEQYLELPQQETQSTTAEALA
jgi:GT2 family glycosyltransferase